MARDIARVMSKFKESECGVRRNPTEEPSRGNDEHVTCPGAATSPMSPTDVEYSVVSPVYHLVTCYEGHHACTVAVRVTLARHAKPFDEMSEPSV